MRPGEWDERRLMRTVVHVPCREECTFRLHTGVLRVCRQYVCPRCMREVPEAIVFMLQSLGVWDSLLADHLRWQYVYYQSRMLRRRRRKDEYLSDFYKAVGLDPL